jgi:thiol-disulfide isomerase/thioredoxin
MEWMMLNKMIKKWKEKKLIDKIGDILFYLFILAMIIPSSRMAVTVAVKRVFAFSPKEISREERVAVETDQFYWLMETEEGDTVNLADYRGKTIFINMWATWCPTCVAEKPSIQKLYDAFKNDDQVVFIIISSEKRETVEVFMKEEAYTFPFMLAKTNTPEVLASRSVPTTYLIAPSGEIVLREVGSKKWHGEETIELIRSLQ